METKHAIFPISAVAEILGVHQRTLRIYDEKGLLISSRNSKNRRKYSLDDIEKGRFIQFLTRSLGVNLAGIKIIIYLLKNANVKESNYLKHIEKVVEEIKITPKNI